MSNYPTAASVLEQVEKYIKECESTKLVHRQSYRGLTHTVYKRFEIREVCDDLSIFDWWGDDLSYSQLLSMHEFLETAIKYGYTGYVCFKVGATGCSHGMWAHKQESLDGYSPDGEFLFHSFRCTDNYWSIDFGDGTQSRDLSKRDLKKILANLDAYRMAEKKRMQELDSQIVKGLSDMHNILKDIHNMLNKSNEEAKAVPGTTSVKVVKG